MFFDDTRRVKSVLFFVCVALFCVRFVRPDAKERQDGQDDAAQDIADYANEKIENGFPRKTEKEEIQSVCHRMVESAESEDYDGEHDPYGGRQFFTGRIVDGADG